MEDHTRSHLVNNFNLLISHFIAPPHRILQLAEDSSYPTLSPFCVFSLNPLLCWSQMNLSRFLTQRSSVTSSSAFLSFRSLFHALSPKGFLWPRDQNSSLHFLHRLDDGLQCYYLISFSLLECKLLTIRQFCLSSSLLNPPGFRPVSDPHSRAYSVGWLTCGPVLTMLLSGITSGDFQRTYLWVSFSKKNYGGSC